MFSREQALKEIASLTMEAELQKVADFLTSQEGSNSWKAEGDSIISERQRQGEEKLSLLAEKEVAKELFTKLNNGALDAGGDRIVELNELFNALIEINPYPPLFIHRINHSSDDIAPFRSLLAFAHYSLKPAPTHEKEKKEAATAVKKVTAFKPKPETAPSEPFKQLCNLLSEIPDEIISADIKQSAHDYSREEKDLNKMAAHEFVLRPTSLAYKFTGKKLFAYSDGDQRQPEKHNMQAGAKYDRSALLEYDATEKKLYFMCFDQNTLKRGDEYKNFDAFLENRKTRKASYGIPNKENAQPRKNPDLVSPDSYSPTLFGSGSASSTTSIPTTQANKNVSLLPSLSGNSKK